MSVDWVIIGLNNAILFPQCQAIIIYTIVDLSFMSPNGISF